MYHGVEVRLDAAASGRHLERRQVFLGLGDESRYEGRSDETSHDEADMYCFGLRPNFVERNDVSGANQVADVGRDFSSSKLLH